LALSNKTDIPYCKIKTIWYAATSLTSLHMTRRKQSSNIILQPKEYKEKISMPHSFLITNIHYIWFQIIIEKQIVAAFGHK